MTKPKIPQKTSAFIISSISAKIMKLTWELIINKDQQSDKRNGNKRKAQTKDYRPPYTPLHQTNPTTK